MMARGDVGFISGSPANFLQRAQVAVITGATSGIGRYITLDLCRRGYSVIAVGRQRTRCLELASWLGTSLASPRSVVVCCDLSLRSQIRELTDLLDTTLDKVDVLINNAGVFDFKPIITEEGVDRQLAVNVMTPNQLQAGLLRLLMRSPSARVVNVGSSAADKIRAGSRLENFFAEARAYSRYGFSKLLMMHSSFEFAFRLNEKASGVVVVHPGTVGSGLLRQTKAGSGILRMFARSTLDGARPVSHFATIASSAGAEGSYFHRYTPAKPNPVLMIDQFRREADALIDRLSGGAS